MLEDKSRKKRWLVWGMVVSIIVLLFSPFMIFRAVNRAKFERKVAELKAAGYPVSLDDLEAAYVLPEGVENAADLYMEAFKAYVEPNEAELELLPVRGEFVSTEDMPPYPPEVIEAIGVSLEKNQECLALIDQAVRTEHCLLPRKRTAITTANYEFLADLKKISNLMVERHLYLSHTGQTERLCESIQTHLRLWKSLTAHPTLTEHLVMDAIKIIAAASLENILHLIQFTDEQLAELQRQLRLMGSSSTFAECIINERAGSLEMYSAPASEFIGRSVPRSLEDAYLVLYWVSGLKDRDAVLLLDGSEQYIKIFDKPVQERYSEIDKLIAGFESYSRLHWLLFTMSSYIRVGNVNMRVSGQLLCIDTMLAVERYRLQHGELPGSLSELVPEFLEEVYLDPFDGKPLRYVLRPEGGYMIYCIGEDGVDNGGVDMSHKVTGAGGKPEYDWPFTVRR